MEGKARELCFYADPAGRVLFDEWFAGLGDKTVRLRIAARLDRLAAGHFGDHRSLSGGLKELRLQFGPGYRIYIAEQGPVLVVLLVGGDKRSQSSDITKANSALADFMKRRPG